MGQPVKTLLSRASKAAKARDWAGAITGFQSVLSRFPGNKKARAGLEALKPAALSDLLSAAQAAERQNAWPEAERHLTLAVAIGAQTDDLVLALARARIEVGAVPQALKDVAPILERDPSNADALNLKGRALREMGLGTPALTCFNAALGQDKTDARTLNNIGLTLRAMGDLSDAADHFRRALRIEPDNPTIHSNLAQVTAYAEDETHLGEMQEALKRIGADSTGSVPLHFALFKALDQLDACDAAFAHLKTGNRLAKAASGYDFKSDAIPYGLSKLLFETAPHSSFESGGLRPIFVTGLPRSGTTLVERILSQAPDARACGELTIVQRAVGPLLRQVLEREAKTLQTSDLAQLRADILSGLADYARDSSVVIDKMPLNFRWIGYICAALPEAAIVHIDRDPMAVAWSLYRHAFVGQGNGFTNDFEDIVRFMVLHKDLMSHWRQTFPDRIVDIRYDHLVTEPKAATRGLAAATQLEWSSGWTHPERAKSQVLTASAAQARQPIYRNSDASWRRYQGHLEPLVQMMDAAKLTGSSI